MAESKKLVLVFKNSIGKEVTFTIEDPKDALTEAEIKAAMDLIVEKNIFKKSCCISISKSFLILRYFVNFSTKKKAGN